MVEEEAVKQGKRVHTCNTEVLQRMTEPSIDVFLKCKYDQLYPDILDSKVILCPSLHAEHWCLVVIYPIMKRMVYLDSLFHCYSLAMQDNIPEETSADVLPHHVQCILPPT